MVLWLVLVLIFKIESIVYEDKNSELKIIDTIFAGDNNDKLLEKNFKKIQKLKFKKIDHLGT